MASVNLWKFNTLPSQCERFPWTWSWRLLYFGCWYHFEKGAAIVYFVTCKQLSLQQGHLKVDFLKCKIIHIILLCIAVKQSIFLWWFINIVIICIIARYTWRGTFFAIIHWPTTILLFLSCFLLNYHGTFIFSQILNLFICGTFKHNLFAALKEIHNLWFEAATTSA